jgi:hypothetical protein
MVSLSSTQPSQSPKDSEEEWFRRSFTTEPSDPYNLQPIDFNSDLLSFLSDTSDFSSDFLQLSFDSDCPLIITSPLPPRPAPEFASAEANSRSLPKGFSYTKRSQGPRQITGAVDQEFLQLCLDRSITFNPRLLGFIPSGVWINCEARFGDLVPIFFKGKIMPIVGFRINCITH